MGDGNKLDGMMKKEFLKTFNKVEIEFKKIFTQLFDGGEAKLITAVDANGVLTYSGGTIDPASGGFEHATGNKRVPSVTTRDFTLGRADVTIKAIHTGTGWVCELKRKLNTGDVDDAVFDLASEYPFGFAIFDNAAIAHSIKTDLNMKFAQ